MKVYVVLKGYDHKLHKGQAEEFFSKYGSGKFVMQFLVNGANNSVFKLNIKDGLVGRFSVERLQYGISWLGDYVNNYKNSIPSDVLERLRRFVKETGDYDEVEEENSSKYDLV